MKQISIWLLAFGFWLLPLSAMAQGMVTEIKIVAVNEFKELADQAKDYDGGGNEDLDFRKGQGGGYVFALSKSSAEAADTSKYITEVKVTADRKDNYGEEFKDGKKVFTPAVFYQETKAHKDESYRGGLNGRNYWCYGGAYPKQEHVYICRTGNTDFNNKVLKSIKVTTSKPITTDDQTQTGGHAGGERYFLYTWHTHESKYRAIDNEYKHEHYCDKDQCKLFREEHHKFNQRHGFDVWGQYPETDPLRGEKHFKQCIECGQKVPDTHKWASYTSNTAYHKRRCLVCGMVEPSGHASFGKEKLPVDEYYHMIYCADCGYLQKLPHDYTYNRTVKSQDCEYSVVEYTCSECYHHSLFEEEGIGHDYDIHGICKRGCLHPYQQPDVEPIAGGDSVYVVKSFGNLYWVAEYVNNRRPKTNVRIDCDLIADDFMSLPWRPIGANDSTAFQGTFDGGGHIISMLQTEEPVAGCGYRGLFGSIAKGGTVKNVALAACDIRGWDYIGSVAGINEGTIDNCQVVFSILSSIGTGKNIGGICGLNKGTISGCTTENSVWVGAVRDYAGGICGTNVGGTLSGNVSQAICGNGSDAVLPETASQQ